MRLAICPAYRSSQHLGFVVGTRGCGVDGKGPCAQYISLKPDKLIIIVSVSGQFDLKKLEQLLCLKSLSEMYWALCLSSLGIERAVRTSTRPPHPPRTAPCPYARDQGVGQMSPYDVWAM